MNCGFESRATHMVFSSVHDSNGNSIKHNDNVHYGKDIWIVDNIVDGKLHISRFGIKTKVNPKDVTKYR